jgi:predicted transcriptional regulator
MRYRWKPRAPESALRETERHAAVGSSREVRYAGTPESEGRMTQVERGDARRVLGFGNRESLDIIDLILIVCVSGTMKTHVMYKCNLNSKQLQQYMNFMLSRKLISTSEEEEDIKRTIYVTTDRGRKLMAAYRELAEIFGIAEYRIDK